jgi:hypothetical protein
MRTLLSVLLVSASAFAAAQTPPVTTERPGQVATPSRPATAAPAATDPNARPTAVIRGRILLANGRPARRASVRLQPAATACCPLSVSTDLDGRYEFTEVRAGEYRISAGKPGYLALEYGQQRPFTRGRTIGIAAAETLERVDITLPASGAIAGRVLDENGDAVEGISVRLLQMQFAANRRQLLPVGGVAGRLTNDLGQYRLYGVPPGQYVVMATPTDQQRVQMPSILPPDYAPTYYPGTSKPSDAKLVTIGVSQEASEIDLGLARVATARISGVVVDSFGRPLQAAITLATSQRSGGLAAEPVASSSGADGSFQIRNVPPGEWVLQVRGGSDVEVKVAERGQSREGEFVSRFVAMNGNDVTDLRLQTSAGSRVDGRVVFDGIGSAEPTQVTVTTRSSDFDLAPLGGPGATANVQPDGTFALEGLNGPRRLSLARTPPAWTLKTIRANGIDVTDTPLSFGKAQESLTDVEIVLTNRPARIGGRVTDARGQTAADYTVIVFATDAARWYQGSRFFKLAGPQPDGTFTIGNLPPGEFSVAAVDWIESSAEWQDPAFLNAIASRATTVTLGEGQSVTVTPRLIVR